MVLTGLLNSPKWTVKGAEMLMMMAVGGEPATNRSSKRKIDVGCEVLLRKVPNMIWEGFSKLERNYNKIDPKAVRYINRAYSCLINCAGNSLCDMILLLALIFGACTVKG